MEKHDDPQKLQQQPGVPAFFSILKTGRRVKMMPCIQQPATGAFEKLYLTHMIAISDSTQ